MPLIENDTDIGRTDEESLMNEIPSLIAISSSLFGIPLYLSKAFEASFLLKPSALMHSHPSSIPGLFLNGLRGDGYIFTLRLLMIPLSIILSHRILGAIIFLIHGPMNREPSALISEGEVGMGIVSVIPSMSMRGHT